MTARPGHPAWCGPLCDADDRTLPTADAVHRGALVALSLPLLLGGALTVTVQLRQSAAPPMDAVGPLLAVHPVGGHGLLIPLAEAEQVLAQLVDVLASARQATDEHEER